ncbi:MAG: thioesterase family protein [Terriglobales bacterium]|jgi:fluoroacetyl-CoA thioesterase
MAKTVPIGSKGEARQTVEFKHTLSAHHEQLPPVYSTPDMIRLMEIAAFHALYPFCDEGELNVGTHINIEHRAATGIGAKVLATAELESFDGRFYSFRVTAHDGKQEIGRGTVGRAVIKLAQFMVKMNGGS